LKKRGTSTGIVIGSLIIGLLIGAAIVYAAGPSLGLGGKTTTITTGSVTFTTTVGSGATGSSGLCNGQTIPIGALNDLSSQLSAQGQGDLAAEQIAIQDLNSYLKTAGCSLTFTLDSDDYHLDTPTALTDIQAMYASGVRVVVGPLDSGTANGILSYANSNHIVLISPSSTSPALHFNDVTNVYLFRTAPNDAAQGQADAREMVDRGAQAVIIINRDDTYGNGLANATKSFLEKDGISAANIKGPYSYPTTTADFSTLITQIGSDYSSLSSAVGASHVAIFSVSFQEIGTLLPQAKTENKALLSTTLPWFGVDGTAQNTVLSNSTTGPVVAQVRLPSTLFNVVNNSKTLDFYNRFKGTSTLAKITGGGAFYTLEGYDDVWLAALSILSAGKNDGTAIHAIFPTVAADFYGLTGWEGLTGNDRIPGSYQIWKVVATTSSSSGYGWVLAGTWDYNTDTVTWISPP